MECTNQCMPSILKHGCRGTAHDNLQRLADELRERIIGQDHIIDPVVDCVLRGELGLADPERPKGNFLFLGPTGTGKTELTRQLTILLHGTEEQLFRFDMSEYQTKESLSSLLGDASGYDGRLGDALLKSNGYGVLLFDEMEKAHRDMMDVFLQILDAARVTTGRGVTHDLSNFYVILTSNVGSDRLFDARKASLTMMKRAVMNALIEADFRPEFLGRFHEILTFNRLGYEVIARIARLTLDREVKRIGEILSDEAGHPICLSYDAKVLREAMNRGSNTRLGARPMRSAVQGIIQSVAVEIILSGRFPINARITADGPTIIVEPVVTMAVN